MIVHVACITDHKDVRFHVLDSVYDNLYVAQRACEDRLRAIWLPQPNNTLVEILRDAPRWWVSNVGANYTGISGQTYAIIYIKEVK